MVNRIIIGGPFYRQQRPGQPANLLCRFIGLGKAYNLELPGATLAGRHNVFFVYEM
jgi:hypothetical protein